MSEVLATVLLTATTVLFLGGFTLVVLGTVTTSSPPPTGDFALDARAGVAVVNVSLVGGTPFDVDAASFALLVNGSSSLASYDLVSAALPGRFSPGDTLRLNLSGEGPAAGARLLLLVNDRETGKLIGAATKTIPSPDTLPAYVNAVPSIADAAFSPELLTADGASRTNLTVEVDTTRGLALVRSVTVNLSRVGGPSSLPLADDGDAPDEVAGDGRYAVQFAAISYNFTAVPSLVTASLPVTVTDIFGHRATTTASLLLQPAPPSKALLGAKWRDLPSSATVRTINLTNVTFRDAAALDADQVQVRISDLSGTTRSWTALVNYNATASCGGSAGVTRVEVSRDGVAGTLVYAPASGCFAVASLAQLNLADVTSSRDASGNAIAWSVAGAEATHGYAAAGIGATNEAVITFFGDSQSPAPLATGLGQADLTWSWQVANHAPTASFTYAESLLRVDVDASASSDPDQDALTYSWQWGDGQTTSGATPTASHVYATGGDYTVTLTVADPLGATSTTSQLVRLGGAAPTASFLQATSGLTVSLDASASTDPSGSSLTYAWQLGDGNTAAGAFLNHTYASAGNRTVTLTVTNLYGGAGTTSQLVRVNRAPALGGLVGVANDLNATLTTSASDADGHALGYAYVWGDGAVTSAGAAIETHGYALPGNYTARVYVNDTMGASATMTTLVTVQDVDWVALSTSDAGTPSGTIASVANLQANDGASATLAESGGAGALATQPDACSRAFEAPCGAPGNWTLASGAFQAPAISTPGSTLAGATSGAAMTLATQGAGPSGLRTGVYLLQWSQSADASAQAGLLNLSYAFSSNVAGQLLNATLVAPNGARAFGQVGVANTSWLALSPVSVPANLTRQGGTFSLYLNATINKNDYLRVDDVQLAYASASAQRFQKEFTIGGLLSGPGLTHHLEVRGRQGDNAETLQIQVEGPSGVWTTRGNLTLATETTIVHLAAANEVASGTMRIRLVDATTTGDANASTWLLDGIRVVTWGA